MDKSNEKRRREKNRGTVMDNQRQNPYYIPTGKEEKNHSGEAVGNSGSFYHRLSFITYAVML